ncbi:MAG TPA: flagellar biosynthesis protein FlhB [Syntrophales bacterium]|nr:flagellar biosynthesis protein FlhB [Syntrophales bacterium]HOM06896.1 flagellar biosynthesis protein FlhB [Syntrophales bacterium]HON99413.1 flagellar biosynthesis protein FlhB [Syntrophales bacterium]HPC00550.1 flagellar biosynthesis protein FlhB [Syntrophales bacterium]HPQ06437.1 flagellar biosynthesis protein FlhB [Syntrophales bacterium]
MAEGDRDQERTEQATPKRREDTHKKGQVAKSREIPSVAILGGVLVFMYFNASDLLRKLMSMTSTILSRAAVTPLNAQDVLPLFASVAGGVLVMLLPLFLVVVTVTILANLLQVGFIFSAEPVLPRLGKINPLKGAKNLFGPRAWVELTKNTAKICFVGVVAYLSIRSEIPGILPLMAQGPWQVLSFLGTNSFVILGNVCWLLLVLAVGDYLYQRWEHEKNLRMTRQEVKDEHKQTEGDPLVKGRIRRLQREAARKRMMAAVPKADVVITNPTHLAVALRYDAAFMSAPVVVAKGAGHVAERIKELAREHRVPVVENREVARVLYKLVDVDGAIPENLYRAVAEILAYVYALRNGRVG